MSQKYKLKRTQFFVEANSFEQLALWQQHHKEYKWESDNQGFLLTIGTIKTIDTIKIGEETLPICVTFSFAKINNKFVCFYDATSRIVDHTMVENFIKENYPVKWDKGTRSAMTDAMNFHHCLDFCTSK